MPAKGKKILFVIAPKNFRDEELFHPKEELEKAGAVCAIASTKIGVCNGTLGGTADAKTLVEEANPADFDAVVFVGGSGSSVYFDDEDAHKLARKFAEQGKAVAAICIAPSTLANAGLLKGKKATAYPSEKDNLVSKGAKFTGKGVEADGKIVTADGPKSARDFGKKIAALL
ncbi:MAG: DJ-1/PfpI family protein [Candidatus Diapherotrites archaeon]